MDRILASDYLVGSRWTTLVSSPHPRSEQQKIIHFMLKGSCGPLSPAGATGRNALEGSVKRILRLCLSN